MEEGRGRSITPSILTPPPRVPRVSAWPLWLKALERLCECQSEPKLRKPSLWVPRLWLGVYGSEHLPQPQRRHGEPHSDGWMGFLSAKTKPRKQTNDVRPCQQCFSVAVNSNLPAGCLGKQAQPPGNVYHDDRSNRINGLHCWWMTFVFNTISSACYTNALRSDPILQVFCLLLPLLFWKRCPQCSFAPGETGRTH